MLKLLRGLTCPAIPAGVFTPSTAINCLLSFYMNLELNPVLEESTTNPGRGYYAKDDRTKQFPNSYHAVSDQKGFVLRMIVALGNMDDSLILQLWKEQ